MILTLTVNPAIDHTVTTDRISYEDRVYVISARPGRIRDVRTIELPRPRQAEDARLLAHQHKILGLLGEEIEQVFQEELGERVHFPEAQHPASSDYTRGMHI